MQAAGVNTGAGFEIAGEPRRICAFVVTGRKLRARTADTAITERLTISISPGFAENRAILDRRPP